MVDAVLFLLVFSSTWMTPGEPCGTEGLHGTLVPAEDALGPTGVRAPGPPGRRCQTARGKADIMPVLNEFEVLLWTGYMCKR